MIYVIQPIQPPKDTNKTLFDLTNWCLIERPMERSLTIKALRMLALHETTNASGQWFLKCILSLTTKENTRLSQSTSMEGSKVKKK